jgi:hypothetical protein
VPADSEVIAQVPLAAVAVLISGWVRSPPMNTSTAMPSAGWPSVERLTVPPRAELPPPAPPVRAEATCSARSRSAADTPTSRDIAMVITTANTDTASSRLSRESSPRPIRGFCIMVPLARGSGGSGGGSGAASSPGPGVGEGAAVSDSAATPNGLTTGDPNQRRWPITRMSVITCSPGASSSTAGMNSNRSLSSGSIPWGATVIGVFPVFSAIRLNLPMRPQITVIGCRPIFMASRGGTMSSISATAIDCGGVSSRTCTAIRRSPAPTPGGIRTVTRTDWVVSGNSERFSASMVTQAGSAPRTRR